METGIVVFSQTGNTLAVAKKIKEKLESQGYTSNLEEVTIEGQASPGNKKVEFSKIPQVEEYDYIVFGSPVHAFSLPAPMSIYLEQLPSLKEKDVSFFVTKQLPFNWTGGNRAIDQMKRICEEKGATVKGMEVVNWREKKRNQDIIRCVENLGRKL